MDTSNTVDKSTIEQAVAQAVRHVRQWTKQELSNILKEYRPGQEPPLIIPIAGHGMLIGNYAIMNDQGLYQMIYRYNDDQLTFCDRTAAIFYAVCMQIGRSQLADQIKNCDRDINRLNVEAERLRYRLKQAVKKRNSMNIDLYTSRYQETLAQLTQRRHHQEKNLRFAKYNNH